MWHVFRVGGCTWKRGEGQCLTGLPTSPLRWWGGAVGVVWILGTAGLGVWVTAGSCRIGICTVILKTHTNTLLQWGTLLLSLAPKESKLEIEKLTFCFLRLFEYVVLLTVYFYFFVTALHFYLYFIIILLIILSIRHTNNDGKMMCCSHSPSGCCEGWATSGREPAPHTLHVVSESRSSTHMHVGLTNCSLWRDTTLLVYACTVFCTIISDRKSVV